MTDKYNWTDDPTVSGESICDTDVLNDCLMHLKYDHSSGSGLNMFDIVAKDHVLSYQETQGFAQLGSWVYKDPSLGISYGYPDFYAKCVSEYENSSSGVWTQKVLTQNGTLGGTDPAAASSSQANGDFYAYYAFDNNTATRWSPASRTVPQTLDYYTPEAVVATSVYLDFYSTDEAYSAGTIQGSTNNSTWYDLASFSGNTSRTITLEINTTDAYKYFRFKATGLPTLGTSNFGKVAEFTITGTNIFHKNTNGHVFYDVSQKDVIDEIYETTGIAWFYGIDTENERVFLPRNDYFFQSGAAADVGKFVEAGLPNITGSLGPGGLTQNGDTRTGAFYNNGTNQFTFDAGPYPQRSLNFDASKSSAIYGKSDTVQPNAVNLVYYMVVGNTVETKAVTEVTEITTSENDTLPLFHFIAADEELNNPAYIRSQGQFNSGNVYTTAYNYLVNEYTTGVEKTDTIHLPDGTSLNVIYKSNKGKKIVDAANVSQVNAVYNALGSAWYYVIDQTNMQFILPRSKNYISFCTDASRLGLDVSAGLPNITGSLTGAITQGAGYTASGAFNSNNSGNKTYTFNSGSTQSAFNPLTFDASRSSSVYGNSETVTPAHTEFYLYFKVSNAVQNLELLDAGEVLDTLAGKVDMTNKQWASSAAAPSNQSIELTLGASGATYTAPADGYVQLSANAATQIDLFNETTGIRTGGTYTNSTYRYAYIPVRQNDVFGAWYNISSLDNFRFIYAEGAKND